MKITIDPPRHKLRVEFVRDSRQHREIDVSRGVRMYVRDSGGATELTGVQFFSEFRLPLGWGSPTERDYFSFSSVYVCSTRGKDSFTFYLESPYSRESFQSHEVCKGLELVVEGEYSPSPPRLRFVPPDKRPVLGGFTIDTRCFLIGVEGRFEVQVGTDLLKEN